MRFMRREEKNEDSFDDDPMSAVGNLFDVALVFIVALLFALMAKDPFSLYITQFEQENHPVSCAACIKTRKRELME